MEPLQQTSRSTPRRRAGNAASQRNYRARQKARLQQLQRLAVEALAPSVPSVSLMPGSPQLAQPPQQQLTRQQIVESHSNGLPSLGVSSVDILSAITSCSERERQILRWILAKEGFSIRNVIKFGLIVSGYAMDFDMFESAKDISARSWLEMVKSAVGDVDMKAVAIAGIRVLITLNVPWDEINRDRVKETMLMGAAAPTQSHLHVNRILISRESLAAAMFANAAHLHIPVDDIIRDGPEYPSRQQADDTKPDLIPTATQLVVAHHPCFDVIPWPVFRSNICFAVSHDPPLIDDEELCLDIMNDGIRCWGSSAQSLNGRGNGTPWDARSWEAAPWFLEKWESLTGGRDSDIWKNSAWWRSMQ